jgi:hypothetical protein
LHLISKSSSNASKTLCIKFLVTSRPLLGRQYTTNLIQIDQENVERDLRLVIQTKVEMIVQQTRRKLDVRRYLENAFILKRIAPFLGYSCTSSPRSESFSIAKGLQAQHRRGAKDFDSHIRTFPPRHPRRLANTRDETIAFPRWKFKVSDSRRGADSNCNAAPSWQSSCCGGGCST